MITFLPELEINANGINQGFDACSLLNQTIHIPEAWADDDEPTSEWQLCRAMPDGARLQASISLSHHFCFTIVPQE